VLTKTVFEILGEPVTWAELLGFVTGIACVALAVAQRIETFPIGIANNVFFIVLFIDARLYADAGLQVVYIVLGVMGWWVWATRARGPLAVERAGFRLLLATTLAVGAATLVLVPILRAAHGAAPGWLFATGERDAIQGLLKDGFHVAFADDGPPSGPITHSDRFVLVDGEMRIRGYYHGSDPADLARLANDARQLAPLRDD